MSINFTRYLRLVIAVVVSGCSSFPDFVAETGSGGAREGGLRNLAQGKVPYFYGLSPTNPDFISDGMSDDRYAIHNTKGPQWLSFDFRTRHEIEKIAFRLEPGLYKSVKISLLEQGNSDLKSGTTVFEQENFIQKEGMQAVVLKKPATAGSVRFVVEKNSEEGVKYSEIEIWGYGEAEEDADPPYVPPASKYTTLVWSDEFNGETIDESKWSIVDGFINDSVTYNRNAVSIRKDAEGSYLAITSKNYNTPENLEAYLTSIGSQADKGGVQRSLENVTWSSGRIESRNKFSFQHGRVVARARVNDSQGIWPAIWMLAQDDRGANEIDILEYLGQFPYGVWTTNHYGIYGHSKGADGKEHYNYEPWSQKFHVYEVEWDPDYIRFFIDGKPVHETRKEKGTRHDGMHNRPFFAILETQVGGRWVGPVDPEKNVTKQETDFLVDWIRIYQTADQPVARFDNLVSLTGGADDGYLISAVEVSDGLVQYTDGQKVYEDKNNFIGGVPRRMGDTSRVAMKEGAAHQYLIYDIPGVQDVHLRTHYKASYKSRSVDGMVIGANFTEDFLDDVDFRFAIYTSDDKASWHKFSDLRVVSQSDHRAYSPVIFDAYGLPEGTRYVKVEFPSIAGAKYKTGDTTFGEVTNNDIQLGGVIFLQRKGSTP